MVNKVEYIGCDCGKGRLTLVAKTKPGQKLRNKDKTAFFGCDVCDKLYRADFQGESPDVKDIVPYTGKLARQEIAANIQGIEGIFSDNHEAEIIVNS